MSDDSQSENATFDSDAFEEWVERTAESKGITRGEVLDQMLSSYWILEELTGMMDEAAEGGPATRFGTAADATDGGSGEAANPSTDPDETESGDAADPSADPGDAGSQRPEGGDAAAFPGQQDLSDLIREFRDLRSAVLEMPDRTQPAHGSAAAGSSGWGDTPRRSASPGMDRPRTTLAGLEDRFEDLSAELETLGTRHDDDIARLEADLEDTLKALQDLESAVDDLVGQGDLEALAVSFDEELSEIQDATKELRGRLAQLEDSHAEAGEELSGLRESHDELDERIEREFDSIENVFQHLLDRTDDLEYRLGAVAESHRDDLEPIEEHVQERNRFAALMREANRKGVSTAVCDNCDASVDLGLLESPRCPECDRTYSGLVEGGWLPFSKTTLETEPIGSSSEGIADDSSSGIRDDQSTEGQRHRRT